MSAAGSATALAVAASPSTTAYRFVKVEEFFEGYRDWTSVSSMKSWDINAAGKTVGLELTNSDGTSSAALIQFFQANIFRFRFAPYKETTAFTHSNTRSIVMDTVDELMRELEKPRISRG